MIMKVNFFIDSNKKIKFNIINLENNQIIAESNSENNEIIILNYMNKEYTYKTKLRKMTCHPLIDKEQNKNILGNNIYDYKNRVVCKSYVDSINVLPKGNPFLSKPFEMVQCFKIGKKLYYAVGIQFKDINNLKYYYCIFKKEDNNDILIGVMEVFKNTNSSFLYMKNNRYIFPVVIAVFKAFGTPLAINTRDNSIIVEPSCVSNNYTFQQMFEPEFIEIAKIEYLKKEKVLR